MTDPIPTEDVLARTFIDLLRRDAEQEARLPPEPFDDGLDEIIGAAATAGAAPADRIRAVLRPDVAAAAVMLARSLATRDGVLRALRRDDPVVSIAVPSADWTAPIERVVQVCALGPACRVRNGDADRGGSGRAQRREALLFVRDGTSTAHRPDKGNDEVGAAVQAGHAVVGIAPDTARLLPRDLMRAAEAHVETVPLDASAVALAIEAVVGSPPTRPLDQRLARTCDASDLRLSVRPSRGADGSLDRLEAVLRAKCAGPDAGPALSELHGFGEARDWGLALADDLVRWRAGEIAFSDCESSVLLSGPPGCGKTQFALALGRTTGLPVLAGSLGQWQAAREGHLGHTLAAMRAFFDAARRAPCIALVDEVDSFGDRAKFADSHRDYSSQVVNALLEILSGAVSLDGVVVVCTTNHPERVDPAIRRSGRLDRHIRIPPPDLHALEGIFRHYLGGDLPSLDLGAVAAQARGLTGADVEAIVRRARALARRRSGGLLSPDDLRASLDDGTPPLGEAMLLRASVHEAGHAVAALALGPVESITLSVRASGGLTEIRRSGASWCATEKEFMEGLVVTLSGRAAEEVVLGDVSAGAASDLVEATHCAASMESRYGFSFEYPLVSLGTGEAVDLPRMPWLLRPVQHRLHTAYERALDLMRVERVALERITRALVAEGFLDDPEVHALYRGRSPASRRRGAAAGSPRGNRRGAV
jgi:cell division protease FtsH